MLDSNISLADTPPLPCYADLVVLDAVVSRSDLVWIPPALLRRRRVKGFPLHITRRLLLPVPSSDMIILNVEINKQSIHVLLVGNFQCNFQRQFVSKAYYPLSYNPLDICRRLCRLRTENYPKFHFATMAKSTVKSDSIDVTAYDSEAVPTLIEAVGTLSKDFLTNSSNDARIELVNETRKLLFALETPRDIMMRHCYADVSCYLHIALLQVFTN